MGGEETWRGTQREGRGTAPGPSTRDRLRKEAEEITKQENRPDHLLDYLSRQAGCVYLSDLRDPTGAVREKLEAAVAGFPVQEASLQEWNAVLEYLFRARQRETAEQAKTQLLKLLKRKI